MLFLIVSNSDRQWELIKQDPLQKTMQYRARIQQQLPPIEFFFHRTYQLTSWQFAGLPRHLQSTYQGLPQDQKQIGRASCRKINIRTDEDRSWKNDGKKHIET